MTRLAKLLQPLAVVGALTMIPLTTSSLAAADANTMKELDTFMDVFNQVRANYVDKVDDHVLVKGAIDGMLAALDPHSAPTWKGPTIPRCGPPPTAITAGSACRSRWRMARSR